MPRRFRNGTLVRVRVLWDGKGEPPNGTWCRKLGTVVSYHTEVGHSQSPAYLVLVEGFSQLFRPDSLSPGEPWDVESE